jgi:hypothetical protein
VVEYRFYNHAEYRTLSPDQKNELWLKRKNRGGNYNGPVNVSGYDPKGPVGMAVKTVYVGMAYDVPGSGRVVILIVNQAINLPHLPHNLLNPMQMRLNDVVVNETPKFQCVNPINLSHTITVRGENVKDENHSLGFARCGVLFYNKKAHTRRI